MIETDYTERFETQLSWTIRGVVASRTGWFCVGHLHEILAYRRVRCAKNTVYGVLEEMRLRGDLQRRRIRGQKTGFEYRVRFV